MKHPSRAFLPAAIAAFCMPAVAFADGKPEWRPLDGEARSSLVLLDVANVSRDGDKVTVNAVLIPPKAMDYKGQKAVMLITRETFDCKAKTRANLRLTVYDVTGYAYADNWTERPEAKPVEDGTNAAAAMRAVCGKDTLPTGAVVADPMVARAEWLASRGN